MASKWLYFTKYGRKKKGQIPSIDLRARTSPQVKRWPNQEILKEDSSACQARFIVPSISHFPWRECFTHSRLQCSQGAKYFK